VMDRIDVAGHYEGKPDTLLTGTPASLFRLAVIHSGDQLFDSGVEFHGDTEKGERFRDILASVDIDWEELLSRLMGDSIAHQIGNVARSVTAAASRGLTSLEKDVSEYLREESRLVPTAIEVDNLLEEIDTLRLDTDRLEARIQRLEKLHRDKS
jgi:ubiquinone biosynthesis protein UbiJ